jgi:hypothetical protein
MRQGAPDQGDRRWGGAALGCCRSSDPLDETGPAGWRPHHDGRLARYREGRPEPTQEESRSPISRREYTAGVTVVSRRAGSVSARPAEDHYADEYPVLETQEAREASPPQVVHPLVHPRVEPAGRSCVIALRPGRIAAVSEHLVDSLARLYETSLTADCAVGPRGSRDKKRQERPCSQAWRRTSASAW